MIKVAAALLATFLVSLPCPGQEKPDTLLPVPVVPTVSLQRNDTLKQAGESVQTSVQKSIPQFLGNDKAEIDEERVFDITVQALVPGERESTRAELERLEKVQSAFVPPKEPMSGKIILGYGSYSTPRFDGWFGTASGTADVLLVGRYTSTTGRLPNQDYRNGHVALAAGILLPENAGMFSKGDLRAGARVERQRYKLHGSVTPARVRSVNLTLANVGVTMHYDAGGFLSTQFHLQNAAMMDSLRTEEKYAGAEFAGGTTVDQTMLKAELSVWQSSFVSSISDRNPFFVKVGMSAEFRVSDDIRLVGGANIYSVQGSSSEANRVFYPSFGLRWYAAQGFTLYGTYEPYVERMSLAGFVHANPYLSHNITLRNPEYFRNALFGTEVEIGLTIKAKALVRYKQAHGYPIYRNNPRKLWSVEYTGTTRILSFESELYFDIGGNHDLGITVTAQRGTVFGVAGMPQSFESELPYFPKWRVSGTYEYRLPFGLHFGTTAKYIGMRQRDIGRADGLPSFVVWDARLEFTIKRLSAGVSVENILDRQQEWWESYAGESRRVVMSVGFAW